MSSENTADSTATGEQSDGKQPGARPSRLERDQQLAEELVAQASEGGVDLVGPDGLLNGIAKRVLEAGLEAEITEHLGYEKHDPEGRNGGNSRKGTRTKTVTTEVGPVELAVPRDRDGFEPQLVKKRQRRLHGVDEMIISLTAKGLTTGEVQAHLAEVYGTQVSRETLSKATDATVWYLIVQTATWVLARRPPQSDQRAVHQVGIGDRGVDHGVRRPARSACGPRTVRRQRDSPTGVAHAAIKPWQPGP